MKNRISISIKKSKTMIFNLTGKLIKKYFTISGKPLDPVHTFCYLGFDFKASGSVKYASYVLHDKANKAMRSLFLAVAKFNIPVKTSVRLFHTLYIPNSFIQRRKLVNTHRQKDSKLFSRVYIS